MSNKKNRKHIWLITGELTFSHPEAEEGKIHSVNINGVLLTADKQILLKDLNRMQQILQMNFHQGTDGKQVNVHNVVIQNVSYLAFATQEEFQAPPAGTVPVPMEPTAPPSFDADPNKSFEEAVAEAQNERA